MKRYTFYLLLCIWGITRLMAQQFVPMVKNFSPHDYHAGLQNWAVEQDMAGNIYVGNMNGMLTYDGYYWDFASIPGSLTIRSVLADGNRIYVGAFEEFGYFTKDGFGKMRYTSLWKKIKGYHSHHDEIWKILKTPDGKIIFQSFGAWFIFDGKNVTPFYNETYHPLYFFQIKDRIYAQLIGGGFCEWKNQRFNTLLSRADLNNDNVVDVIPLTAHQMILCTESHGMYLYDGKKLQRFQTDIDAQLRKSQINHVVITKKNSLLVIGTILDGLYGINLQGKVCWHFNTYHGLRNNTVLGLLCDRDDNVWAALDTGIALIYNNASYEILNNQDTQLGMVYDVYKDRQHLYIASNQHAYLFYSNQVQPIEGTLGQNWHITHLDNQLIIGNNRGPRILSDNRAIQVPGSSEASSTALKRYITETKQDYLIESSYYHLRVYRNIEGTWHFQNEVQGFGAPISQLEIDNKGSIWAAHMNRGLYKIELSDDMSHVERYHHFSSPKGVTGKVYIMKIRGEIVVSAEDGLYIVRNDKIQPFNELNKMIEGHIVSSTPINNNSFWLASDKGYAKIEFRDGKYLRTCYLSASAFGLECGQYNRVRVFDGVSYFCYNGGVMRMHDTPRKNDSKSSLVLAEAFFYDLGHQRHSIEIIGKDMPNVEGNVTLRLSYPNFNNTSFKFKYSLDGNRLNLHTVSEKPEITYNNLKYGDYQFTAEVIDEQGKILGRISYSFTYPRPIYLSIPAIILYVLLLGIVLYFAVRWKIKREQARILQQIEKEKMERDLIQANQQHIIEEQQKKILEQQLQEKGRDIATLAMDAVHLESDEYWELYRENFDLIHKNFFRILRERYPELTPTDLKYCALLRLNLGTKDIVNFTGVSIRGVEGARYRLRRKLQLPENVNLVEFLIDLK